MPVTIGLIAAGTQAAASGISALGSNRRRKDREAELDRYAQQSPLYQGSKPIGEYYQQALNRYNENPFTTPYYLENLKQSERAATQALGALQTRGAAIGGVSRINAILADAKNRGVAGAMQNKNVQFGQLGSATQMKNADLMQQFDINKMTPYNRNLSLKQMKAQAANQEYAQDVSNTMGALSNAAMIGMYAGKKTPTTDVPTTAAAAAPAINSGFPATPDYGFTSVFGKSYGNLQNPATGFKSIFGKSYGPQPKATRFKSIFGKSYGG